MLHQQVRATKANSAVGSDFFFLAQLLACVFSISDDLQEK